MRLRFFAKTLNYHRSKIERALHCCWWYWLLEIVLTLRKRKQSGYYSDTRRVNGKMGTEIRGNFSYPRLPITTLWTIVHAHFALFTTLSFFFALTLMFSKTKTKFQSHAMSTIFLNIISWSYMNFHIYEVNGSMIIGSELQTVPYKIVLRISVCVFICTIGPKSYEISSNITKNWRTTLLALRLMSFIMSSFSCDPTKFHFNWWKNRRLSLTANSTDNENPVRGK